MLNNFSRLIGLLLIIGLMHIISAQAQNKRNTNENDGLKNIRQGITSEQLAEQDWTIQCQGCHGVNAEGFIDGTPKMNGQVSKFLDLEGGRAYIVQVPGVANTPLSDARLANVLNWTLVEFDPDNIAADSKAYTEDEVRILRQSPLFLDAADVRKEILSQLE